MIRSTLLAAALLAGLAQPAAAQRIGAYFVTRAGAVSQEVSANVLGYAGEGTSDLDYLPGVGLGVRADLPLHRFLLVGALFEAVAERPASGEQTYWQLDFDVALKVRYGLNAGELRFEPYVGVPVGFTLGRFADPDNLIDPDARGNWPGWNVGALAGLNAIYGRVGGYLELGWHMHQVFQSYEATDFTVGDLEISQTLTMQRFSFQLGVQLVLD